MEPVYTAVESTAKALSLFQGLRMTRVGLDNIPTEGGAVLAVNHTGYLDFVQLALAVGAVDRKLRLMAKAELAHNKVMAFLMRGGAGSSRSTGPPARAPTSLRWSGCARANWWVCTRRRPSAGASRSRN